MASSEAWYLTWFPLREPYLRLGAICATKNRPKIGTQRNQVKFASLAEYTVHVGFSLVFEHEYATQEYVGLMEDSNVPKNPRDPNNSTDLRRDKSRDIQTSMKMFALHWDDCFPFVYVKIPDNLAFNEDDNFDVRPVNLRLANAELLSLCEARLVIIENHILCPNGWATARLSHPWGTGHRELIPARHGYLVLTQDMSKDDIERFPSQDVFLRRHLSPRPFEQQINAIYKMWNNRNSLRDLYKMLLSASFEHFPPVNLYGTLRQDLFQDIEGRLLKSEFNSRQMEAFNHLKALSGPFALIQGPPGTGKTYWLLWCLLPFLNENSKSNTKRQVLIATPTNESVFRTAKEMNNICIDMLKPRMGSKMIVVVRVQHLPGSSPMSSYSTQDALEILNSMASTQAILNSQFTTTNQSRSPSRRADSSTELTYVYWMLRLSGIISDGEGEPDRSYTIFRECFDMFRQRKLLKIGGKEGNNRRISYLCQGTNRLLRAVLEMADVIVCTPSAAGHPTIVDAIKPAVVAVDEAAKWSEPEMWPILAHYYPAPILMAGDHCQLGPTVKSDWRSNPFYLQLRFSLFERLIEGANKSIMLQVQHRVHPDISTLVSQTFYKDKLIDHDSTRTARAYFLRGFNRVRFGIESNLLFLDFSLSRTEMEGYSKKNVRHAMAAIAICKELLEMDRFAPKDIVILVPYEAQYQTTLKLLTEQHQKSRSLGLRDVSVKKIDSFQGGESPIVIFDLTVTTNLGFLDDETRLNVALSRAKEGLYILGNMTAMRSAVRSPAFEKRYAPLMKVLNYISGARLCARNTRL
ncbi:hypothetical protein N7457_005921 [Penicillium paradoxum]|uniref:uncharacterized protein n=1 Tax=Penicillium paradoxum TaxID=176176 RepID=UPI0025474AFE|nr:uncharacterized protein N7457_005921 [Penicillium paradoxum]KAJ5780761.1 hypothetical protein N7457_005921 [Penicillium paradoxum]